MAQRKSFPLRLPPELYDALHRWAAADLRSVNAQIEFLLRESLHRAGRLPSGASADPASAGDVVLEIETTEVSVTEFEATGPSNQEANEVKANEDQDDDE